MTWAILSALLPGFSGGYGGTCSPASWRHKHVTHKRNNPFFFSRKRPIVSKVPERVRKNRPQRSLPHDFNRAFLEHALRHSNPQNLPPKALTPEGAKHASRPTRRFTLPVYEPDVVEGNKSNPSLFHPLSVVSSADTECPCFHPLPKTPGPTTRLFGWVPA